MWNLSYYTSPLIITYLYRRGYFVAESITSFAKVSTGIGLIVMISLCMRSFGRSQTGSYKKFFEALTEAKANPKAKDKLRVFDFDFKDWPVDFDVKDMNGYVEQHSIHVDVEWFWHKIFRDLSKRKDVKLKANRSKPFWISTLPCEIAAYIAIHTFGIRMIYPGSVKLIQSFLHPVLVQGRAKLVEEEHAKRYKLRTVDNNDVDTIFMDNRNASDGNINGKTLVICSEGNAGFYEIGIMTTPLSLKYSVLGWNHPGFGGSTVRTKFKFEMEWFLIDANADIFVSRANRIQSKIKMLSTQSCNLQLINLAFCQKTFYCLAGALVAGRHYMRPHNTSISKEW